jgi:hypothetical protein
MTSEGYIYTKGKEYKHTEYWMWDITNIGNASVVYKNGGWVKGSGWVNAKHKSHLPDMERFSCKSE